jgi:uncharacterized membrane protein
MAKTESHDHPACQICGADDPTHLRRGILAGPAVAQIIRTSTGQWSDDAWICEDDLNRYRHQYVQSLLVAERGEITALDAEVLESLRAQEVLSRYPDDTEGPSTPGERLADRMATFGGSWTFISLFMAMLVAWIAVNSVVLLVRPFDPYPFIFLNLVQSCVAALQAPVIMMSQNRQEARDRLHAMHDYQVNLKAELEIRHLHQKLDHLLSHQWERLVAIQEIQMQSITETRSRPEAEPGAPSAPAPVPPKPRPRGRDVDSLAPGTTTL